MYKLYNPCAVMVENVKQYVGLYCQNTHKIGLNCLKQRTFVREKHEGYLHSQHC